MFKKSEDKYAYWRNIMGQQEVSGKSQQAFCKENKLSFTKFKYYRYHLEQLNKAAQAEPSTLVPVKLSEKPISEVNPEPTTCEIAFPSGLRIRFSQHDLTKTTARFIKELLSC